MRTEILLVLLILGAVFLVLALKGRGNKRSTSQSPATTIPDPTWRFLHSYGMPTPVPDDGGCRFDFPQAPGSVNYLVRGNTLPIDLIAARFTVAGGGFTPRRAPEDGDATLGPALVSLIVYVGETRYYSRNSIKLAEGSFTLSSSGWITVDGHPAVPPTPDRVGVVFGWEAGRGHGVHGIGHFILKLP